MNNEQNNSYPAITQQAQNLVQFGASVLQNVISGEGFFVTDEVQEKRLETCRTCYQYDSLAAGGPRCKSCGCFLLEKTLFVAADCPLGLWEKQQ